MSRFAIELNAKFIKLYQNKNYALKIAKLYDKPQNIVRVWNLTEQEAIWTNDDYEE